MSRKLKIAGCLLAIALVGLGAREGLATRQLLFGRSAPVVDRIVENGNPAIRPPTQLIKPRGNGFEPIAFNQGQGNRIASDIQVERITLGFDGFEPKEIRRPASPFVLAINNRSRLSDVSFELFRDDGHKVHEMKGQKGQLREMKTIDLPQGNYLLKEVNHPEWVCHIVLSR